MWSIRDAGADNDTGTARVQMCAAVWCAKMSKESRAHIKHICSSLDCCRCRATDPGWLARTPHCTLTSACRTDDVNTKMDTDPYWGVHDAEITE